MRLYEYFSRRNDSKILIYYYSGISLGLWVNKTGMCTHILSLAAYLSSHLHCLLLQFAPPTYSITA